MIHELDPRTRQTAILTILGTLGLLLLILLFPWHLKNWGTLSYAPAQTVTVTGYADQEQANQIANFNAGITAVNDDRQTAIDSVNNQMNALIQSLKDFGIPEENIQTQNLSVYQEEEPIDQGGRQITQPGRWRVSNEIRIELDDLAQTQDLINILTTSGATNIYGPNFSLDNQEELENQLIEAAIQNARTKAQSIADSSGHQLGQVITVNESGSQSPIMPLYDRAMGMGGGAESSIQPGTSTISKTLTVTFQLR